MSAQLHRVLCVVGPTAVGKSTVAEGVACRLGGAVVSVDSMQVYRGMNIGTAKTPPHKRLCPLHMVDMVDVSEPYSVARFQRDARSCIDALLQHGKTPVLCGGTGLYLDAVIDEMSFPHGRAGSPLRARYELIAREEGPQALHEVLQERDPQSAGEIHPNNVRRVVRALEMLDEGVSYAEKHQGLRRRASHYPARIWALTLPRDVLYARIDARVDAMFKKGLVDEVTALRKHGLDPSSTAGGAIGYKEIMQAQDEGTSMDEARSLIKRNTRRFAKRQLSWLRRDGRATWVDLSEVSVDDAIRHICADWKGSEA